MVLPCLTSFYPINHKRSPMHHATSALEAAASLLRRSLNIFLLLGILAAPCARAGLTVDIHLYHDNIGYLFYPYLNATTNLPGFPDGNYQIVSPQIPTNGSQLQYKATNNTISEVGGGGNYYYDFNSFIFAITNGQWSIWVTNSTSTNQYPFTVNVAGVTSTEFGAPALAVVPTNGSVYVANQPLFQWAGPTNWVGGLNVNDSYVDTNGNYYGQASASLSPTQTLWACPVTLPNGTNDFNIDYVSHVTAQIIASVPLNNGTPISAWTNTATLESYYDSLFTVGAMTNVSYFGGHTNVAHYTFDNSGYLGQDGSGNGNDLNGGSVWGGPPNYTFSTNAEVGGGAAQFFGNSSMTLNGQSLTNMDAVLAGSFTFSAWVKTTNSTGNDTDDAVNGASIFWAYDDHNNTNDAIPLAITGSKAAFSIRDNLGNTTTIHSLTSVNDGNYHLITTTRDQGSGIMTLYVDGNLEATTNATTQPLDGNNYYLSVGGNAISSYTGLLDDLQVYSGVLGPEDVTNLYSNPGTTVTNYAGFIPDFNLALGTTHLNWSTSGDAVWLFENTNTYNGATEAMQSGGVINTQSSTLSLTITGPGTISFNWSSIANDPNGGFDYQFGVDGADTADIYGDSAWATAGPFQIPSGTHTLTWTTYANGDTDPTEAGYLEQVNLNNVFNIAASDSPTNGAAPLKVKFTSAATDTLGNAITNWNWNFGDGSSSALQNPTHTYAGIATYTPSLTVKNALGETPKTTGLQPVAALPSIKVTANPTVGKAPLTVQFKSPSSDSSGVSIVQWNWNFGDGTGSSAQNPSHTYTNVASYKPILITLNGSGETPVTIGPGVITATLHTNAAKDLPGSALGFTYNGFGNTKGLQFMGNATSITNGDGAVLELTPPAYWQAGAVWSAAPIPFGPNAGFSTFFTFRLSNPGGNVDVDGVQGADGIAFLIQSGGYQLGAAGGGIGYEGITNSLAVEFDTWDNFGQFGPPGEINGNHVAVNLNGIPNDPVAVPITNALNNGNIWYAWIDYEGVSQDLEVRVSEIPIRPLAPTLEVSVDLPGLLGGTNAFVGFTAGTGDAYNEQNILSWKFSALPTTRFTGTFNATNLPPGLKIDKGLVMVRHIYAVSGVKYTNYSYVPINIVSNLNAQIAFESGIAELNPASALPNPNAIDLAISNNAYALDSFDTFQYAMLASYTNSGSGGEGAVINYDNPDYINFAPYYANLGFPPFNMTEQSYTTLQDQVAANPPPGLFPPPDLSQLQINDPANPGPGDPQWISMQGDGSVQGDGVSYSLGTFLGTVTVRQQIVYSPPGPIAIASPRNDGANFLFDFSTVSNQTYTVWSSTSLSGTNWGSYTNLTGDGYFQEISIPITNAQQNYYRLSSP